MARALGAAPSIADTIIDQLSLPTDKARDAGGAEEPLDEAAVSAMSDAVWRMVWPAQRLRQREFFSFGMEALPVERRQAEESCEELSRLLHKPVLRNIVTALTSPACIARS